MTQQSEVMSNEVEEGAPRARWPLLLLALGVVLVALPLVAAGLQKKASRPPGAQESQPQPRANVLQLPALIAFNDVVQKRLATVPFDNSFGMSRLITDRDFRPVTPTESRAITQLKSAGLDVALFMGGRNAFDRQGRRGKFTEITSGTMLTSEPLRTWAHGHRPYVPVRSYPSVPSRPAKPPMKPPADLPTAAALQTRIASLLSDKGAAPVRWKSGSWDIVAVPVPASQQACVDCHNQRLQITSPAQRLRRKELGQALQEFEPLQVGDVAGVAIYAYHRREAP